MAHGKDLYDENRRLRAEIDRMVNDRSHDAARQRDEKDALAALILASTRAFLEGRAHLVIERSANGASRITFSSGEAPKGE
ncbi:MAG: hypothetical protein V4564_07635 [Pseudomonadota bacterium]